MAKLTGPLFSFGATGTVGDKLTIRKKNKLHVALDYNKPGDKTPFESSSLQKDQRGIIGLITIYWQCMDDLTKIAWEKEARAKRFKGTGYHYFLHLAKTNLLQYIGLCGYWSMNYNVGNQIYDLSGNANHGTLKPSYPTNCPVPLDSINSNFGKALSFDGVNDYVNVADSAILRVESGSFTVSLWIKPSVIQQQVILFKGDPRMITGYTLIMNRFGSDITLTKGGVADQPVSYTFQANNWYHIVAVQPLKGNVTYYINGVSIGSYSNTSNYKSSSGYNLCIGDADTYFAKKFNGLIDEARILNRALSPTEIFKHYNLFR